ncbi:hypothetical protein [Texcoconibacillus texcoconensis]|uniref:Uncharacterized protein n=1 Tax=Texcoconibacillus texcoconensis TaxID=1095777 RepID=A0A840QC10_9BACI|nr:hypothetical protein [Texcoconibacillus texcoconensis]MBB5171870.1 hypothetical protein [Texcoconibacillus texcoconensis]
MKYILGLIGLLAVLLLAACSGEESSTAYIPYESDDFNMALVDTNAEEVTLAMDEKAFYVYFTGVT